jgi:asparagine synthetase B (glutamine-hydrolysing)
MPGLIATLDKKNRRGTLEKLLWTIDYLSSCNTKIIDSGNAGLAIAWLKNDLYGDDRIFEDDRFICLFAGDLIGYQSVPWIEITKAMADKKYSELRSLKGPFALCILEKGKGILHAISDRRSQFPLFYSITDSGILLSSTISTFCHNEKMQFNPGWLYEFLYFNYPVGQTTPVKNVSRVPHASVLSYNLNTGQHSIIEYTRPFRRAEKLIEGRNAIQKAKNVFQERMSNHIPPNTKVAISLTSGFDSRTVLAYSTPLCKNNLETYTYGIAGCTDLKVASSVANSLGIKHQQIIFDDSLIGQLSKMIYETVYLSGGLERVTRSTLNYVYRILTNDGTNFSAVLTGIAGDHLFRDHVKSTGNIPSLVSADMAATIQSGTPCISKSFYKEAFGKTYGYFEEHIRNSLSKLEKAYGPISHPEPYMSFLVYEVSPKYFAGEHAIASNYTTLRSPYWDDEIISLAYEISFSTIGFSESLPKKNKYLEAVLQANLIKTNNELSKLLIRGIPLEAFSINNTFIYNLVRLLWRGPAKIVDHIKNNSEIPLEDWPKWVKSPLGPEIDNLLSGDSLISRYVTPEFLEELKIMDNEHWIGKFVTAEILLRLIENGWDIKTIARSA